jgi:hypothetical protein
MSDALDFRIEWLDAPGVTTPELACTWARQEIWVGGRCVSQVEAPDGTLRRSVYGSVYPLAEWIAANWWILIGHIRPSAVETRYWTWPNVRAYPWLASHNFRGAGDGMAWPNLTLVVEGAVSQICWAPDLEYARRPIRFASEGVAALATRDVIEGLASIVDRVLERLSEEGLPKTKLAEEWEAIARTSPDEREFCLTAAKLGLDPYSVPDDVAADIISVASELSPELVSDFFDSADPAALSVAARWIKRAVVSAEKTAVKARESLRSLHGAISTETDPGRAAVDNGDERPWITGYSMAKSVRHQLGIGEMDLFDTSPWVGLGESNAPSSGIQGVAVVSSDRVGLILGLPRTGVSVNRFGQARALGRVLLRPGQTQFVLSPVRGNDEKVARAFAAEILAPAAGIQRYLTTLGKTDDSAIEAVASRYRVSPLLVRHQYDNQIAGPVDRLWML